MRREGRKLREVYTGRQREPGGGERFSLIDTFNLSGDCPHQGSLTQEAGMLLTGSTLQEFLLL
jgi:hypothetical protein